MTIQVPDTIKKEANRCQHNLACLATGACGNQPKCKVDRVVGKNVLFLLVSKGSLSCRYRIPFGCGLFCACPVHYYLYNTAPAPLRYVEKRGHQC
jgi:hypothetical protein